MMTTICRLFLSVSMAGCAMGQIYTFDLSGTYTSSSLQNAPPPFRGATFDLKVTVNAATVVASGQGPYFQPIMLATYTNNGATVTSSAGSLLLCNLPNPNGGNCPNRYDPTISGGVFIEIDGLYYQGGVNGVPDVLYFDLMGPVLYSGSPASPVLQTGTFSLTQPVIPTDPSMGYGVSYTSYSPDGLPVGILPSASLTISAGNPVALAISSLSPNSASAGGPAFTLTVNGTGFSPGASVSWNGTALTTSFVSPTQVTASVPAALVANPGNARIEVTNPGGPYTNVVTFTVSSLTPVITSISPTTATAGGPGFTLTVNGAGFGAGAMVAWNGASLATNDLSSALLSATVRASLIGTAGNASITVVSAGVTSNAETFSVNPASPASLIITTGSALSAATAGVAYAQTLGASGGVAPYKGWVVTGGSLPPGMAATASGSLTGTPTAAGTFAFTIQVTDSAGATASQQFTLTVNPGVTLSPAGIVNSASYSGGSVAPGEIVTIFGSFPGPSTTVTLQLDSRGYVTSNLAGLQVFFDGLPATLIYAAAGQVSAIVPYSVDGRTFTQVQVSYQGQSSNLVTIPVSKVNPGIFTINASGTGQGAIVNPDGSRQSGGSGILRIGLRYRRRTDESYGNKWKTGRYTRSAAGRAARDGDHRRDGRHGALRGRCSGTGGGITSGKCADPDGGCAQRRGSHRHRPRRAKQPGIRDASCKVAGAIMIRSASLRPHPVV